MSKLIVIRVDASVHIGSGHVMRCLVLADSLKCNGYKVVFATRPQKGDLIPLIKQRGFSVYELSQPANWLEPKSTSDYSAWLQVNESDDAKECATVFGNVHLFITDHYGIGALWHKKIKSVYKCKIVAIDDLVRKHFADLIIDQTLLREPADYALFNPESKVLTGTQYAILNDKYSKHHIAQLKVEKSLTDTPRILLTMGGVDAPNATLKVLQIIKSECKKAPQVTVLLSPRSPHYKKVKEFSQQNKTWVTHFDFVDDMAELMSEHDIAIGAPGSTSWERACIGLPSIVIALADNQKTICRNLAKVKAAISLELNDLDTTFMVAYLELLNNYNEMRNINLQLCDGKGIERITQHIIELSDYSISLRSAIHTDIQQVYDWQCKPETRCYALNKSIPAWEDHQAWMTNKLKELNDYFYIIEIQYSECSEFIPVGVVRLDLTTDNVYTLSIFISPEYFGKGIAKNALKQIDRLHPNVEIHATVLKENKASQALFGRAGYQKISEEQFSRKELD